MYKHYVQYYVQKSNNLTSTDFSRLDFSFSTLSDAADQLQDDLHCEAFAHRSSYFPICQGVNTNIVLDQQLNIKPTNTDLATLSQPASRTYTSK